MAKEWGGFLKKIEDDESAYLVLTGDMMNNATKTSVSDVYSEYFAVRAEEDTS